MVAIDTVNNGRFQGLFYCCYGGTHHGLGSKFPVIALDFRVVSLESKDAVAQSNPRYP